MKIKKFLLPGIFIFAFFIRFYPLLEMGFDGSLPFGQGGFYIKVAEEIIENNFSLPKFIPHYTSGGTPFAYPPLVLYFEAVLIKFLGIKPFVVSSVLPSAFSFISVIVFYFLAKMLLENENQVLFATFVYTVLPDSFLEHLGGEGLIESFGTILFVLTIILSLKLASEQSFLKSLFLGIAFGFSVLSSPGAAYAAPFVIGLVFLLKASKKDIRFFAVSVITGLLISAPYWFGVISFHSSRIFTNTLKDQYRLYFLGGLKDLFWLSEINHIGFKFYHFLALGGILLSIKQKSWFLLLLLFSIVLIPREFVYLIPVPLCLLAAKGFFFFLENLSIKKRRLFRGVVLLCGVILSFVFSKAMVQKNIVDSQNLAAMRWVKEKTPVQSEYLVIADEIEWFPQITQRTVINVWYGAEWKGESVKNHQLTKEIKNCETSRCLKETLSENSLNFDYLYLSEESNIKKFFDQIPGLRVVYEIGEITIYKTNPVFFTKKLG